ncbi:MAG: hypothetical protein IPL39_13150 [Opitutaceae bacterium]|nr:hypothetical protein [Opitutaceae bacterium]
MKSLNSNTPDELIAREFLRHRVHDRDGAPDLAGIAKGFPAIGSDEFASRSMIIKKAVDEIYDHLMENRWTKYDSSPNDDSAYRTYVEDLTQRYSSIEPALVGLVFRDLYYWLVIR